MNNGSPSYLNYIAGEWVEGTEAIENFNPSDLSDLIGRYTQADKHQLENAIEAASKAQTLWAKSGLEKRYTVLMAIGNELMERSAELGRELSREEGKPLNEGVGEVYRSGQFFTYFAAEVLRQIGDIADSVRPDIEIDMRREPVGVVGVISPWNFPMATAAWKIAPALAFGNAVIWKPANLVPQSAIALSQIIAKQDLPSGVFNLVMGAGSEIGEAMATNPNIDAITFTGSVDVGKRIASKAVTNLTKIQLEMGSKNALVVLDDADIDLALAHAINGGFGGSGQKCTASSRLIVQSKIHDEFVEEFTKRAKDLVVGHALEEGTQLGPVPSETQLKQNLDYIALAKQEGGELLCTGEQLELKCKGYYMSPTVVAKTQNDWRVNREEMFAPIVCVQKADTYEEALAKVNDTTFGLTSGIMTTSLSKANHFRHHANTGCVMVNLPTAGTDYHVAFGGRGDSSYGSREQGQYAKEFYTSVKTTYLYAGEV